MTGPLHPLEPVAWLAVLAGGVELLRRVWRGRVPRWLAWLVGDDGYDGRHAHAMDRLASSRPIDQRYDGKVWSPEFRNGAEVGGMWVDMPGRMVEVQARRDQLIDRLAVGLDVPRELIDVPADQSWHDAAEAERRIMSHYIDVSQSLSVVDIGRIAAQWRRPTLYDWASMPELAP